MRRQQAAKKKQVRETRESVERSRKLGTIPKKKKKKKKKKISEVLDSRLRAVQQFLPRKKKTTYTMDELDKLMVNIGNVLFYDIQSKHMILIPQLKNLSKTLIQDPNTNGKAVDDPFQH